MHTKFSFINFDSPERGRAYKLKKMVWERGKWGQEEKTRDREGESRMSEIIIIESVVWFMCIARIKRFVWNWLDSFESERYPNIQCVNITYTYTFIANVRTHATPHRAANRTEPESTTDTCWPNPRCNALSPYTTHRALFSFRFSIHTSNNNNNNNEGA